MQTALKHTLRVIGAPSDAGAAEPGASLGPAALRRAGLLDALVAPGLAVQDGGDLQGPPNPRQAPVGGYRHLAEVSAWCQTVAAAVGQALAQDHLPLLLGGDHSLAIGSLSAVARHCRARGRHLRVLWLDAHADCNSRRTSPSANLHGMPLACLRGLGPDELVSLSGQRPALAADALRLVGVRSMDPGETVLVHQLGLQIIDMAQLRRMGVEQVMDQVLAGLDEHSHLHLSLDVDFLDPGIAPGTGTAVADGATLAQAHRCMHRLAATGRLASVDVMELNPTLDHRQITATHTVELLRTLLAGTRPHEGVRQKPAPEGWPAAGTGP